ncbi:DUF982 domain-containing protein [Aquamicrobium segne]|uniref:DUF982 domain-containing protein n=1 Tax=Aquamicrobium segne TaxID=469547 RepID=A0ABW0GXF3_9HYPH
MDRLQFIVPVRIRIGPEVPIEEIYSVEQAFDFLQNWPVGREGPLFQAAMNACLSASVDLVSTEEAFRAFNLFCRVSGLLASDMRVLAKDENKAEFKPEHTVSK